MTVSRREALSRLGLAGLALVSTPLLVACQQQEARPSSYQGLIVDVRAASFVKVASFTLRTNEGTLIEMTAEGDIGINAAHMRDHMVLADPVLVFVRYDGSQIIALRVDDVPAPGQQAAPPPKPAEKVPGATPVFRP